MKRLHGTAAALALLLAAPVAAACPLGPADGTLLRGQGVELAFVTDPAPAVAHRPLQLAVRVCPAGASLVAVDATMPEHRHGMNYR
ncbi:MAG: hypothetical protein ACK5V2_12125, partial [Pseudomonadota bacterium]